MNLSLRPRNFSTSVAAPQGANERGPFEFAPVEQIAALALGALVWLALAFVKDVQALDLHGFSPIFSAPAPAAFLPRLLVRFANEAARDGFIGPIALFASVAAAFLARLLRGASVRGLSRWTCFTLSMPLFQVLGIACITSTGNGVSYLVIKGLIALTGFLLLMAGVSISLGGGVYVLLEARDNKRERAAFAAVPLLWVWQLVCFLPWVSGWLGAHWF